MISDHCVRQIIETAGEQGIGYWAHFLNGDDTWLKIAETDDEGKDTEKHVINAQTIQDALTLMVDPKSPVPQGWREPLVGKLMCYRENETVFDAEECDVIIQIGLFNGEIKYG